MSSEGWTANERSTYIHSVVILDAEGNGRPLNAGGFGTVFERPLIGVTFAEELGFKLESSEHTQVKSLGGLCTYEIKGQYPNVLIKLPRRNGKQILTTLYGVNDADIAPHHVVVSNKMIGRYRLSAWAEHPKNPGEEVSATAPAKI